jgi:hypothetical protein
MGRHEPAGKVSLGYQVGTLRLVLNELAQLITRAWFEYEAQDVSAANTGTFVGSTANNAIDVPKAVNSGFAVETPTKRKYEPSTQEMLRRIDALLAPFADEPGHDN